jgi:hypothetical protein
VFAELLGVEPGDADTFVSLGGDSLSYVEVSVRLEELLGSLPRDWHTRPVRDLKPARSPRRGPWAPVETSVAARAVAIVLVVGTHADLFHHLGGAHALLAIAGFNFARFQLGGRSMVASVVRIALPSMCWIGAVAATTEPFSWQHALLLNGVLGAPDARWEYWFIEALVYMLLPLVALFSIPSVARAERRWPLLVAGAALAIGLTTRFDVFDVSTHHRISRPHELFWLFALGWAAARAATFTQRVVVSAVAVASVAGFFGNSHRELIVGCAIAMLLWLPAVPVPRVAVPLLASTAAASMYIYLSHFQVYPPLERGLGSAAAVIGSVVVGTAVWLVAQRLTRGCEGWVLRQRLRLGTRAERARSVPQRMRPTTSARVATHPSPNDATTVTANTARNLISAGTPRSRTPTASATVIGAWTR